MNGVVSGGWGFVLSAYGITVALIASYVIRTIAQWRRESAQTQVRPVTRIE